MSLKPATKASVPSTAPPAVSLKGGSPQRKSELKQSHENMRQLLVRLNAVISVFGNDPALNRKLTTEYLPEIAAAISRAKWAGGEGT